MIVPPGEFKVFGRVSIRSSNITVDFSGSIVECQLDDTCIFVGDGITLRFYLSQSPFTRGGRTIVDEEYKGTTLDPTRWTLTDPGSVISVNGGKLQVAGGNGVDGHTLLQFVEQIELGGAFTLQHGDFIFTGASDGAARRPVCNRGFCCKLPCRFPR